MAQLDLFQQAPAAQGPEVPAVTFNLRSYRRSIRSEPRVACGHCQMNAQRFTGGKPVGSWKTPADVVVLDAVEVLIQRDGSTLYLCGPHGRVHKPQDRPGAETKTAEEDFVRMLLEAAGGNVADQRDVELARAAGNWALRNGWSQYIANGEGFICDREGLQFWINDTAARDALMIMVRISPGTGWQVHGRYPVAHVGHALDLLAAEELLPPQFSAIARRVTEASASQGAI